VRPGKTGDYAAFASHVSCIPGYQRDGIERQFSFKTRSALPDSPHEAQQRQLDEIQAAQRQQRYELEQLSQPQWNWQLEQGKPF
jgi:hypothetical protein